MIKYLYYILLGVYCIFLAISIFQYLTRPAPGGDASVDWALGIFYSAGLACIILIALFLRDNQGIGLTVLCIPLLFIAMPALKRMARDLYAGAPSLTKVPPLTVHIQNITPASVHVKLDCWFATANSGTSSLYKTLDYNLAPFETNDYPLSAYETGLLSTKSKFITVMMYEVVTMQHREGAYKKEIQPCMQFYDEPIEAFRSGTYKIVIDVGKNTETFKSEVATLKGREDYGSGVF